MTGSDALRSIAAIAREADLGRVAAEASNLDERLSASRFFVACVGQFKRGKSTVLNALTGDRVLPAGVTPVTSAITILRHGAECRAVVFYTSGGSENIAVNDVPLYVTEEHNHGNARGVAAVEVFLPAALLANGLCLVDTPGIGSAFAANTAATRAFVPHIDAALVVLGADPPISGEELALVLDVLGQVPKAIFVLNKADRFDVADVRQAREFTERLIAERLGHPIGPILEISAADQIAGDGPTRDWDKLRCSLAALTRDSAEILRHSYRRGVDRLMRQLRDALDERAGALLRPIHESESRIVMLRRSVADAETMLHQLGILLAAEQRPLLRHLQQRQHAFVELELAPAKRELDAWIDRMPSGRVADRAAAFECAATIARAGVEAWLARIEPEADDLYRNATLRFTELATEFLERLTTWNDPAFASLPRSLDTEAGLREERHFSATHLMHLTAPGLVNRVAHFVLPRHARIARAKRDAGAYLERLIRTNTTRVVFDLEQRVEVSRRQLESELRFLLNQITTSAERALERARARHAAGEEAVAVELGNLHELRTRLDQVTGHARDDAPHIMDG